MGDQIRRTDNGEVMLGCSHTLPLHDAIDQYVDARVPIGGFLTALLENNLVETFGRADSTNESMLREYVEHVYWCVPSTCWGSPEKVQAWLRGEGMAS